MSLSKDIKLGKTLHYNSKVYYRSVTSEKVDLSSKELSTIMERCYLIAFLFPLDTCYQRYKQEFNRRRADRLFTVEEADWYAFHSPFCKLVQKGFARLMLNDFVSRDFTESRTPSLWNGLDAYKYVFVFYCTVCMCACVCLCACVRACVCICEFVNNIIQKPASFSLSVLKVATIDGDTCPVHQLLSESEVKYLFTHFLCRPITQQCESRAVRKVLLLPK